MANGNDDRPTIERGSYGDRGSLEEGRPDGHGKPSDDAPILPSRQPINIPTSFPRRKKP